jgi:hypothetical protein
MSDDLSSVTRFEIIDNEGRSYVKYGIENIELTLQDDGSTLKIFLKSKEGASYEDWQKSRK